LVRNHRPLTHKQAEFDILLLINYLFFTQQLLLVELQLVSAMVMTQLTSPVTKRAVATIKTSVSRSFVFVWIAVL
jgi:hypothetical protein